MSTATTHSITGFVKDVRRNRETRDFDASVIHPDSTEVYLGSRERSWDAEQLCDEYGYAQLQQQPVVEVEAIAAADPLAALRAEIAATTEPNTRRRLIGRLADQALGLNDGDEAAADTDPLLEAARWLDAHTSEGAPPPTSRQPANVPIATLSNGLTVEGTLDRDGTPNCAYVQAEDGHFFCDETGHLAGEWAGIGLEIPPDALPKLRTLFTSNTLVALQDSARLWGGEDGPRPDGPVAAHLRLACRIALEVEQAARQGLTRQRRDQLTMTLYELVDDTLGIVDFTYLPVLEQVCEQRDASKAPVQKAA